MKPPLWIERLRVQDAPVPGEQGGGSDVQLDVASTAIADQQDEIPYVPPLPVPLERPVVRDYRYQRGLRSSVWLVNPTSKTAPTLGTLVGGGPSDAGEDFAINSIMVDNFTVQWAYWPEVGVFVPPFNFGRVFRFDGSRRKRVLFEAPAGLATVVSPSSTQANQILRATFYEELLAESSGQVVPSTNQ